MSEQQQIVQLEVDKIMVPEDRVTSVVDDEIMQELEESIKQHGILQPIQVALVDNKYVLIDGLHRLVIAKKLGINTVPAIVKQMSEDQLLVTNLIMNRQRGRSNPAEEARILVKLVDEYGYDFDKAREMLSMSRATADKYYRIGKNCSAKVLDYVGKGMLSVGCAFYLSFLDDKAKQDEIADLAVKWGYNVDQCKVAVQSILNPQAPAPYIVTPTGEMKPKPIPVYPCGKEVDPQKVVVIQFDADVWPLVEQALKQLCSEGVFYNEVVEEQPGFVVEEGQAELDMKKQEEEKSWLNNLF
jgi:ParB family chromosome partitioning protein